jgi:hypothetical protein
LFAEAKNNESHTESTVKKQLSDGGRTPKEKSSFGAFMSDIFKSNKATSLGTPKEGGIEPMSMLTTPCEMEDQWKSKKEVQQNIERYENGEKGHMHSFLYTTLREWLNFCHSVGMCF